MPRRSAGAQPVFILPTIGPVHLRLFALALVSAVALTCGPAAAPRAAVEVSAAPLAPARGAPLPERVLAPPQLDRTETYVQLAATLARGSSLAPYGARLANWPVTGRITSPFGPRWGGFHNGIDIAGAMNTPVRAAAAGQVVAAGKPYLAYGDTATIVIVAHGSDLATVYVHLSDERPPIVQAGQRVSAGEIIAYTGSTGWSTGPHVHFMTIVSGRAVDPIQYLP